MGNGKLPVLLLLLMSIFFFLPFLTSVMENVLQIQIAQSHLKHFIDLEKWGEKKRAPFFLETLRPVRM